MKQLEKNYKRIVIKIGSSLFYSQEGSWDTAYFSGIVDEIAHLVNEQSREVLIVSSGAIALGMDLLNLKSRPKDLVSLQAAAAMGQNALMDNYSRLFKKFKINCAQVLLTWDDFDDRQRYLNAKNTLFALLRLGSIPVINENDTISTEEIKFGDNDRLSALAAVLIRAELLIILSDVEGLLDKNKQVIRVVDEITPQVKALACSTGKKTCVGGMITKIDAAKITVDSGIPCIIANGRSKNVISSLIKDPASTGTLFLPKKGNLSAKKSWIAFSAKPKGKIIVDDGARIALMNKKSLLAVGVISSEGAFDIDDIVSVTDKRNCQIAKGKAGLSSRQLNRVKGKRYNKEVIHRDNIVIL